MKVLFVTRKWPPAIGGMETYSVELCNALDELVDLDVQFLPGKGDGSPPSPVDLLFFLIKSAWLLLFNAKKYEVVHLGDFVLAPLGWFAKLGSKKTSVLLTIHGLDILYGNRPGFAPKVYSLFVSLMRHTRFADHFIANSENTARLSAEAGFSPVKSIPLGVDTKLEQLSGKLHDNSILFLGRLVKRKGAAWFASNVLPRLKNGYSFKVVGKTWDMEEERILKQGKNVELLGFVSNEELALLKSKCLLAVMPNQPSENNVDVEGFGLVAAELSMHGVPLIASNIEGITSAIIDQKTGFLLDHNDVDAWIKKIEEIQNWTSEQRAEYSDNCSLTTKTYYSWERVAKDTLAAYQLVENTLGSK